MVPASRKRYSTRCTRVETDLQGGNWPISLDSRLKALSISLAKCVSIELERQNKNEEINY